MGGNRAKQRSGALGASTPQTVGFLLVPGFALMSYAAAVEPLRAANLISGQELYRWWHAAPGGKPVMASNGLTIIPDCGTDTERDVDMVFVCAGGNPALSTTNPCSPGSAGSRAAA